MLDNILNSVKRGAERVQRRGEEVAQVTRLKMEVYGLSRDLEGHFARLGRSYHAGADADILQGIRQDIRQTEDEIAARERLIQELSEWPDETPGSASTPPASSSVPLATTATRADAASPAVTHPDSAGFAAQTTPGSAEATGTAAPGTANSTNSNSPRFIDSESRPAGRPADQALSTPQNDLRIEFDHK